MRLIQFETAAGERRVGVVEGERALEVQGIHSTRELAVRATVSAIRRPATAVMFATTSGTLVPTRSGVVRSTARRDPT